MDIYLEDDKKQVVKVFGEIKDSLNKVCCESATKDQVTDALEESIRKIQRLRIYLNHVDGIDVNKASDNKPGLDVVKSTLKVLCGDIEQGITDTSWIEGTDTYAESQRAAVNEMLNAITQSQLTGAAKANAEQDLDMLKSMTPPDGAAEWVVREMRNEMLLAGIKSHLNSALISVVEL